MSNGQSDDIILMTSHTPTERLGVLKAHTRSVLCCKAVATENLLVTGGEVCSVRLPVSGFTAEVHCPILLNGSPAC